MHDDMNWAHVVHDIVEGVVLLSVIVLILAATGRIDIGI